MIENTKRIHGIIGENAAVNFLTDLGYKIIARNYHANAPKIYSRNGKVRRGEIDIIATFEQYIIFVEVKSRQKLSTERFGRPANFVNKSKKVSLRFAINDFLNKNQDFDALIPRFDIIEVYLSCDKVENILLFSAISIR